MSVGLEPLLLPSQHWSELQRVTDIESHRRLRSASSPSLHVPRSLHKTIGDRAFPVAAAKVWNTLPPVITSLPSLEAFKRALKTELFRRSYGNAHHRQQYHWHYCNTWHTATLKFCLRLVSRWNSLMMMMYWAEGIIDLTAFKTRTMLVTRNLWLLYGTVCQ